MNKQQRFKDATEKAEAFNKQAAPYYKIRDQIIQEYWDEGFSVGQIAEELGWKTTTVTTKLTTLGIDWRAYISNTNKPPEVDFKAGL